MRYDVVCKIGEGNKGEVYKVKLENGEFAAIKWAKNYEIDKEWEILNFLNGFYAPKPIARGNRYFIMELIEGRPLKEFLHTSKYYEILRKSLIAAYELDKKGVFHSQLGRFYHIIYNENSDSIKFIDFERATFSKNPRNFMQIVGYYLFRDEKFDKKELIKITDLYKLDKEKALKSLLKVLDESKC